MKFQKGNQLWKLADPFKNKGRRFETPKDLWNEAVKYFEWCEENDFTSLETTTTAKGKFTKEVNHKRPFTWQGLFVFLNVSDLKNYQKNNEFSPILTRIRNIMYEQKFAGASNGIFNAGIIAKELGLVEKKEIKQETTKLKIKGLDKLKDD